jgi:hypothetical protein
MQGEGADRGQRGGAGEGDGLGVQGGKGESGQEWAGGAGGDDERSEGAVGIALIRESAARQSHDVTTVSITRPRLERRIAIAWREDNLSPAARAFLAVAREL